MIETQDQLFANLMEQLLDDLPAEPETRVVTWLRWLSGFSGVGASKWVR